METTELVPLQPLQGRVLIVAATTGPQKITMVRVVFAIVMAILKKSVTTTITAIIEILVAKKAVVYSAISKNKFSGARKERNHDRAGNMKI